MNGSKKQFNLTFFKVETELGHIYTVMDDEGNLIVDNAPLSRALKKVKELLWEEV
ncbi:MAG: hypothetical protein QHH15_00430 [Candidatus Thermoplasmatota archaeon]|nr:hypothetical protein [Candidatus Thermoplasmatota archaeon]MDH7506240.1 hypothetical protein [Candidatus Thermoplasmatota archaeon]